MIERNCAQARRMAQRLAAIPGAKVLNDVVLSQVLVQIPGGDNANRAAVAAIQRDGTCSPNFSPLLLSRLRNPRWRAHSDRSPQHTEVPGECYCRRGNSRHV
jgi:hypothetical protein